MSSNTIGAIHSFENAMMNTALTLWVFFNEEWQFIYRIPSAQIFVQICVCVCVCVCITVMCGVCMCKCVSIYVYVCMYVCVHVCVCACRCEWIGGCV